MKKIYSDQDIKSLIISFRNSVSKMDEDTLKNLKKSASKDSDEIFVNNVIKAIEKVKFSDQVEKNTIDMIEEKKTDTKVENEQQAGTKVHNQLRKLAQQAGTNVKNRQTLRKLAQQQQARKKVENNQTIRKLAQQQQVRKLKNLKNEAENNLKQLQNLENDDVGGAYDVLVKLQKNYPISPYKDHPYHEVNKVLKKKSSKFLSYGKITDKFIGDMFKNMEDFIEKKQTKSRQELIEDAKATQPLVKDLIEKFNVGFFKGT